MFRNWLSRILQWSLYYQRAIQYKGNVTRGQLQGIWRQNGAGVGKYYSQLEVTAAKLHVVRVRVLNNKFPANRRSSDLIWKSVKVCQDVWLLSREGFGYR